MLQVGLEKALEGLALDESSVPAMEDTRKLAQELNAEHPLQGLLPRTVIRGTRLVRQASSKEEINEAQAVALYNQDIELRSVFLSHLFRVFEAEGGLDSDRFMQMLTKSPFLDDDILVFVRVGVQRYFASDYVSALRVLVPKLEEARRRTIGKLGSPTTSRNSSTGGMRERPLDEVLSDPELAKLIGSRKRFSLEHVLNSEQGDNLRNDVAHGLMSMERCTRYLTQRVLHIYLMLTPFVGHADDGADASTVE